VRKHRSGIPRKLAAIAGRSRKASAISTLVPSVRDGLWDSHLIDPTCGYQHLLRDGPRHQLRASEDLLATAHRDATIAGEALETLLKPVAQALGASCRSPFRSLRERRMATSYEGIRGYSISTGRPDAVPAAPKPPVPSIEEQKKNDQVKSDSSGARTRGESADMNFGAQYTANLMRGD
jgi:hypothetical protein